VSAVYYKKERVGRRVDKVLSGVVRSDFGFKEGGGEKRT
jgi:hypothetical protein